MCLNLVPMRLFITFLHLLQASFMYTVRVKSTAAEVDDEQGDDTAGVDQDVGLDFVSYCYFIGNKTKIQVQL